MTQIQLEFNMNNISAEEMKLILMSKQISEMNESLNKTRKKLFAEMNQVKKLCVSLQQENELLKQSMKPEKIDWAYKQDEYLFLVKEPQIAVG